MARKATELRPIMTRLPERLRARLERAAEQTDRSMNAEIVDRLERSFDTEAELFRLIAARFGGPQIFGLMKLVSAAMQEAGESAGFYASRSLEGAAGWMDNPYAYEQASRACQRILDAYRPPGEIKPPEGEKDLLENIGRGYANGILAQMLGNKTSTKFFTPERAAEAKNDLGSISDRATMDKIQSEETLFTADRNQHGQAVARLKFSGSPKEREKPESKK